MCFRRRNKKGLLEAEAAVAEATVNLKKVKSRAPEVHEVAQSLKNIRERNHFAEQLQELLGGNAVPNNLGGRIK